MTVPNPRCAYCGQPATHRCLVTSNLVCWQHVTIGPVSAELRTRQDRSAAPSSEPTILRVTDANRADLVAICLHFWEKTDNMLTFGRTYDMLAANGLIAYVDGVAAGALGWVPLGVRGLVVDLSVYPEYQGTGVARALLREAERQMADAGLSEMILSTTNDNLLALRFYQRYGFVVEAVLPGSALEHHIAEGVSEEGFAGIPVRDEVRLRKPIGGAAGVNSTISRREPYIRWLRARVGHDPLVIAGVTAFALDDRGRILLQRKRESGDWALPGGIVEVGESAAQAAVREVAEETGCKFSPSGIVGVYTGAEFTRTLPNGDVVQPYCICLRGTVSRGAGGVVEDAEETAEIRFFGVNDLPSNILPDCRVMIDDALNGIGGVMR